MESRVTNERVENALQHPSHTPLSHIISPPPYASLTHSLTHPLITPLSLTELQGPGPDHQQHRGGQRRFLAVRHHLL